MVALGLASAPGPCPQRLGRTPHLCPCRCWAENLVLPVMPHHVPICYIMPSYPIITCNSLMSLHAHPTLLSHRCVGGSG